MPSVFITGGGSGIGAALTEGFLRQGARVAFVQRSDAAASATRWRQGTGARPLFLPCDITDIAALRAAIRRPPRRTGRSACWSTTPPTTSGTSDDWTWTRRSGTGSLAINLKPYFFAAQAVIPGMRAAGGGAIVNFSSISYMMGDARLRALLDVERRHQRA